MADPLYLSLWFPSFDADDMLPHALDVIRQFPFSTPQPGITYVSMHPVSWNEATVLEQRFRPGVTPEEAILHAADQIHEDYAYVFEASWDLWVPSAEDPGQSWSSQPSIVKFIAHGLEFDGGVYEQDGHVLVDFGLDTLFLHEELKLTSETETRVRANVARLVEFTSKVEKNSGASARLLWSESEETFAQKLVARLQKVQ